MNSENLNKIISDNIKKYRLLNNIEIKILSELTGIPFNTLENIEKNTIDREITILEIYKLSTILNISVNKLLESSYDK